MLNYTQLSNNIERHWETYYRGPCTGILMTFKAITEFHTHALIIAIATGGHYISTGPPNTDTLCMNNQNSWHTFIRYTIKLYTYIWVYTCIILSHLLVCLGLQLLMKVTDNFSLPTVHVDLRSLLPQEFNRFTWTQVVALGNERSNWQSQ